MKFIADIIGRPYKELLESRLNATDYRLKNPRFKQVTNILIEANGLYGI